MESGLTTHQLLEELEQQRGSRHSHHTKRLAELILQKAVDQRVERKNGNRSTRQGSIQSKTKLQGKEIYDHSPGNDKQDHRR